MRNRTFFFVSLTTSFTSILCFCILIVLAILNYRPRANFDKCAADVVSLPQNCSDTANQVCLYDATGTLENPNRIWITESACLRLCGPGFDFWDVNDILQRFFQWVAPAIVLIAHYHFPPLPKWNYGGVLFHLLGDPVDCLWSMLSRIQVGRVFYHKAKRQDLSCSVAIATIWCAYDEMGYQDASNWFDSALRDIRHRKGDGFLRKYTEEPISNKVTLKIEQAAQQLISHRSETQLTTWVAIFGLVAALGGAYVRTWIDRNDNQTAHTIAVVSLLFVIIPIIKLSGNIGAFTSPIDAIDIIQKLRLDLGPDYQLFPPFSFAKIDRWDGRETKPEKELACEEELANLTPGSPGSTKVSTVGVHSVHMDESICREAFTMTEWSRENAADTLRMLQVWPEDAAYKGMNSIWRPRKDMVIGIPRSFGLFLLSFIFTLCCSFVPAICISYYTPLKGFSCRSLAWTVVALLWCLSLSLDWVYKSLGSWPTALSRFSPKLRRWLKPFDRFCKARSLWRITLVKDIIITFLIISIVTAQVLGLYNSCWCRAGGVSKLMKGHFGKVDLTPFTQAEWIQGWTLWGSAPTSALALIVAFIAIVELTYSDSGKLLNRSQGDKDRNLGRIKELQYREMMKEY